MIKKKDPFPHDFEYKSTKYIYIDIYIYENYGYVCTYVCIHRHSLFYIFL